MDCQEVKQLLAFVDRKSVELDTPERDAVQQHLLRCPDCAELAQTERGVDQALAAAMRDVAVPVGLKQTVLERVAADRRLPWKGIAKLAAAAMILLAIGGGAWWYSLTPVTLTQSDLDAIYIVDSYWGKEKTTDYFKHEGLDVPLPDGFDYQHLISAEVVHLRGHKVAKLSFYRHKDNEATVLILPNRHFRTDGLSRDPTRIEIISNESAPFTYLILFRGSLKALQVQLHQG